MLVLARKVGEKILINGNIVINVAKVKSGGVVLTIDAPPEVIVDREEVARDKERTYVTRMKEHQNDRRNY